MAIEKTIILKVDADDGVKEVESLDKSVNKLDKSIEEVNDTTDTLGKKSKKTGNDAEKGFSRGAKGVKTFSTAIKAAGIALKAAGIGLVVAALVKFQDLFLGDASADALTLAAETINNIFRGNSFEDAVNNAKETLRLRKQIEISEKEFQKTQLRSQEAAEIERQIRDDVSLSIFERIRANERLGEILKSQLDIELAAAETNLQFLTQENEKLGTQESLLAKLDAEIKILEIKERITSQSSEQKVNEVALQQELNTLLETEGLIRNEVFKLDERALLTRLEASKERLRREFEAEDSLLAKQMETLDIGTQAYADAELRRQELSKDFQISTLQTEKQISDEKKNIVNDFANAAIEAFGRASTAGKAFALAQAIWNVHEGITKALTLKPPFNFIAAAAVALKGFASVKSILSTPNPAGGGVGGAPAGALSTPQIPQLAPEFNVIGASSTNQLAESISSSTDTPIQAFVVASSVTTQQALDRQIEDTATFG